jgi:hypothetical protein
MYRVIDCIRYEHDYRLVLLAVVICADELDGLVSVCHVAEIQRPQSLGMDLTSRRGDRLRHLGHAFHRDARLSVDFADHLRSLADTDVVANCHMCERSRFLHCRSQQILVDPHFRRCCGRSWRRHDALRGDASDEHLWAYSVGWKFGRCLYRHGSNFDRGCDVMLQTQGLKTPCRNPVHRSGLHVAFYGNGGGDGGI